MIKKKLDIKQLQPTQQILREKHVLHFALQTKEKFIHKFIFQDISNIFLRKKLLNTSQYIFNINFICNILVLYIQRTKSQKLIEYVNEFTYIFLVVILESNIVGFNHMHQ